MGTDLAVVPENDVLADPVESMALMLNRAKGWLGEAQSLDEVRQAKAVAVGYEAVIREKELAFDAQLSATEIVRRCERRIGQLVREGQREGTIRTQGQRTVGHHGAQLASPPDGTRTGHELPPYQPAALRLRRMLDRGRTHRHGGLVVILLIAIPAAFIACALIAGFLYELTVLGTWVDQLLVGPGDDAIAGELADMYDLDLGWMTDGDL
jgi:hypothetical protein